MNFIVDESVDSSIVGSLGKDGHHVLYVAELDPGLDDEEVFRSANVSGAMLVTADKDFGEIVFRQKRVSNGVLLIRLAGLKPETKAAIISSVVRKHEKDLLENFTVITRNHTNPTTHAMNTYRHKEWLHSNSPRMVYVFSSLSLMGASVFPYE